MPDFIHPTQPATKPVVPSGEGSALIPQRPGSLTDAIENKLGKHWKTWTFAIGAATLALIALSVSYARKYSAAQTAANTPGTGTTMPLTIGQAPYGSYIDPTTGLPYGVGAAQGNYDPNMTPVWAQQLLSDIQQIQSGLTPTVPPTTVTPPPTTTPPPVITPNNNNPLIPFGAIPQGYKYTFGQDITIDGNMYETGPGSNGILWGVPVTAGHNLSLAQWNAIPMGAGGKQAVYGPKSLYH